MTNDTPGSTIPHSPHESPHESQHDSPHSAQRMILGMMRIHSLSDEEIRTLVDTALQGGITMFDHADIYGAGREPHECERRFGEAIDLRGSLREQFTLQSKCGIVRDGPYYDFSRAHILSSVEGSLKALGTDHLDVLLLHRPDALMEPDEVASAFDELESSGKVRSFGVSNHTPGQLELLRRSVEQPLQVNQIQLSLAHAAPIAAGITANMSTHGRPPPAESVVSDLGTLDYCRARDIQVQAWSPFQGPGGAFIGDPAYAELNEALTRIGAHYGATATTVAAAWLLRHPAGIQVVLGTTNPGRVVEALRAVDVPLTRPEWYELLRASGQPVP